MVALLMQSLFLFVHLYHSAFSMMFALRQMMTLSLMMFPSEMMSASPDVIGKHRIIASKTSNIIFAKQMHHIATGDASLK